MENIGECLTELTTLLLKLNSFNSGFEKCFFDNISPCQFSYFIEKHPDYAERLQKLFDHEVELRIKIHQSKLLLEMKQKIAELSDV